MLSGCVFSARQGSLSMQYRRVFLAVLRESCMERPVSRRSLRIVSLRWTASRSPSWTRFELFRADWPYDRNYQRQAFSKEQGGAPIIIHALPPSLDTSRTHRSLSLLEGAPQVTGFVDSLRTKRALQSFGC